MNNWYAVYTHLQKENIALENLRNQDFEAYLPKYEKLRKHARQVSKVQTPLFPRYLFVNFDPQSTQWLKINHTRGVVKLLSDEAYNPVIVPEYIINGLQQHETEQGLVTLDALALFKPGDKVRITAGAFKNLEGEFQALSDQDRVKLLVNMLNKPQKVEVPLGDVELV